MPTISRLLDVPRFLLDCSKAPFRTLVGSLLGEPLRPSRMTVHPNGITDETIANFATRRLGGRESVDDLLSAICHGIYAGDIYKLSARCLIPLLWAYESTPQKVLLSLLLQGLLSPLQPLTGKRTLEKSATMHYHMNFGPDGPWGTSSSQPTFEQDISMVTLKDGMQGLVTRLRETLSAAPNVDVKCNAPVTGLHKQKHGPSLKVSQYYC